MAITTNFTEDKYQGQYIRIQKASDATGTGATNEVTYMIPSAVIASINFSNTQTPIYDFTGSTYDPISTNSGFRIEARLGNTVIETQNVTFLTGTVSFTTPSIVYDNIRVVATDDIFSSGVCVDSPTEVYIPNPTPTASVVKFPFSNRAYAPTPEQQHGEYIDADPSFVASVWRQTLQPVNNAVNVSRFVSQGGDIPDDLMYYRIGLNDSKQRVSNSAYMELTMGIPWKDPFSSNVYWNDPNTFDGNDPINTGALIGTGNNGPYRLHISNRYVLSNNPVPGGGSGTTHGVRLKDGTNSLDTYPDVQPFTEPGSFRYDFMSFSPRDMGTNYSWPGITAVGSADDPHYAFNIWQIHGKFADNVPFHLGWGGRYFWVTVSGRNQGIIARDKIIDNTTSGLGGLGLEGMKDQWVDVLIKVRPGYQSDALTLGYMPGYELWYRIPHLHGLTWTYFKNYDCNVDSGLISSAQGYGIPPIYAGLGNGGIYPSSRISGSFALDNWRNWHDPLATKYIRCNLGEPAYVPVPNYQNDPGFSTVASSIDTAFGF